MAAAAVPIIGAVAGGVMAKKSGQNPLLGAALGGLGGSMLGPAMAGLGAAGGAAGAAGAATGGGGALSGLAAGNLAMPVSTTAAMGASALPTAGMAELAMGLGPQGLLSGVAGKKGIMAGGNMMLKGMQPNQPMPQPMPMPVQQRQQTRSMMSLGQQPMMPGRGGYFTR